MNSSERKKLVSSIIIFIVVNLIAINLYIENIKIFYLILLVFLLALNLFFYKIYHKKSEWLAWILNIITVALFIFTISLIISLLDKINTVE